MSKLITVLDLGSSKIAALRALVNTDGSTLIIAAENMHSRGITRGDITDIDKATDDVSSIMRKLERGMPKKAKKVFVTTRGADVKMDISRGMVPLSSIPREITKKDVKKCLEMASMIRLPLDIAIVERFVRAFYVDRESPGVQNPVGLYGIKLEAETFIALANRSKIRNITKCIDHAGLLLDGIYLSILASAESVLGEGDKEKGVLLCDIGGSLTEVAFFKNGALKNFNTIKEGAKAVLNDSGGTDKEKLESLLKKVLASVPAASKGAPSVVITGGGALLDGVIEEAEKVFATHARIGIARQAGRSLNSQDAIIHTSTIGLATRMAGEYTRGHSGKGFMKRALGRISDIYESYF